MKTIVLMIVLGLAMPLVGCATLKQSNRAHHAIEDHNYNVDKVVVKVHNGHKTAVVHMISKIDADDKEKIRAIVKGEIPDAEKVTFRGGAKKTPKKTATGSSTEPRPVRRAEAVK